MIITLLSSTQSLDSIFLKANLISGQSSHLSIQPQQYQLPGLSFPFWEVWLPEEKDETDSREINRCTTARFCGQEKRL